MKRRTFLAGTALLKAGRRDDAIRVFERAHALIPAYGGEDSPAARLAAGDCETALVYSACPFCWSHYGDF